MEYSDSFAAMGTRVDVIVNARQAPAQAFARVRILFENQENALSRFRPESALARLNAGEVVRDKTLAAACRLALQAHEFTQGIFNPMVLPALAAAGYDRSFESIAGGEAQAQAVPDPHEALRINGDHLQLMEGALDLGGIAKGWTVDLAIDALAEAFRGVMVNAGGDMRVMGSEAGGNGWQVGIESPEGALTWSGSIHGALATSTTTKRRWRTASGRNAHHLIDPRTGLPAATFGYQTSVAGPLAWQAECWAKAILIGGLPLVQKAKESGYRVVDARGCAESLRTAR